MGVRRGEPLRGRPGPEAAGGLLAYLRDPPPRPRAAAGCRANNNDGGNSNHHLLLLLCVRPWASRFPSIISFTLQNNPLQWMILSPFYSSERLHNLPIFTARKMRI